MRRRFVEACCCKGPREAGATVLSHTAIGQAGERPLTAEESPRSSGTAEPQTTFELDIASVMTSVSLPEELPSDNIEAGATVLSHTANEQAEDRPLTAEAAPHLSGTEEPTHVPPASLNPPGGDHRRDQRQTVSSKSSEEAISQESKEHLRKNLDYLISNVKPEPCLRLLRSGDLIAKRKYDEIVQMGSREAKVEAILDLLTRGTQGLYDSFIDVLKDTSQKAVVLRLHDAPSVIVEGKKLIEKSKAFQPEFIEHLRFEGSLLTHLEGAGVITGSERDTLNAIATRRERAGALLSMLEKGEEEARNNGFIQSLIHTDQTHLIRLLQDGDRSGLVPGDKRSVLQREKTKLIRHIGRSRRSMSRLLNDYVEQTIITMSQRDVILARHTVEEQSDELLDILICRPYCPRYVKLVDEVVQTGWNLSESTRGQGVGHPSYNKYLVGLREGHIKTQAQLNARLNSRFGIESGMHPFYVRLSMASITRRSPEEMEEYIRRTAERVEVRGDITIEKIFDPIRKKAKAPTRVLLMGGAGTGKSTVTQQLAYDWASGGSTADKAVATFHFECRQFTTNIKRGKEVSLVELIFKQHDPCLIEAEEQNVVFQSLTRQKAPIRVIFDGLDELSKWAECDHYDTPKVTDPWEKAQLQEIIYNVIHRRLLPKAQVLVTSRPISSVGEQDFDRSIVALGFSKDSIRECILALCKGDVDKCNVILDYIQQNPELYAQCVVPLHCVLLGAVLRDDFLEGASNRNFKIDTTTRLNTRVVLDDVWKRSPKVKNDRYDLTERHKSTLRRLAALAAKGMLGAATKIIFDDEDLKELKMEPDEDYFGLLEVKSEESAIGSDHFEDHTFSFLHLSMQEYLAAVHVALTWDPAQVEVLSGESHQRLDMVRMFLSGLLGDCEGQRFLKAIDPEVSVVTCAERVTALLTRSGRTQNGDYSKVGALNVVRCVAEGKLAELVPALEGAVLKVEEDNSNEKKEGDSEQEEEEKEVKEQKEKTLDLSSCPGGLLPHHMSSIGYFVQASTATSLGLDYNKIGAQGAQHLARALENNSTLRELRLYNNDIGDQGALHLGKGLERNTALRKLMLNNNKIGAQGAQHLGMGLEGNSSLRELNLERNQIGDQGAKHLAGVLETNTALRVLGLDHNKIGDQGAQHLGMGLEGNSSLRELNLWSNQIGDQGAQHLRRALEKNTTLRELDLVDCEIGDVGVTHLARALAINTALQALELSSNPIHVEGAKQLAEALRSNHTLKKLNLDDCEIGDVGAAHLAQALAVNTTLQALELDKCKIGDVGAAHLAQALAVNTALQKLGLDECKIGDVGAAHLAQALAVNTALQKLGLEDCEIGDVGAAHLSQALAVNTALQALDLRNNQLHDEGGKQLAEALRTNQALKVLQLSGNKIGHQGAQHLGRALEVNTTLRELWVYKNEIGYQGAQHLARALKKNTTLRELRLSDNQIGDQGAQHLASALEVNTTLRELWLSTKHSNKKEIYLDEDTVKSLRDEFGERIDIV